MICAVDELAIGEDHSGILILPPDTPLGVDFVEYAGLRDDVLEITVTPDRGYAVSIRGVARELATAYEVPYTDPAHDLRPRRGRLRSAGRRAPARPATPGAVARRIADPTACDRFVLREVRGFDPARPDPAVDAGPAGPLRHALRLARRRRHQLPDARARPAAARVRPVQAAAGRSWSGARGRARRWRRWTTSTRTLYPDDILITDDSGPISMAGTMGGLATEIDDDSTDIVIEGAHFTDTGTAKMSRRHRLHSEASYRFERGVDRELPPRATAARGRAARHPRRRAGRARADAGAGAGRAGDDRRWRPTTRTGWPASSTAWTPWSPGWPRSAATVRSTPASHEPTIAPWRAQPPDGADHHAKHDRQHTVLLVTPPSWRPDLTDPADLAEEVIRLEGYGNVPVRQPRAIAGHGLTARQRRCARSPARSPTTGSSRSTPSRSARPPRPTA